MMGLSLNFGDMKLAFGSMLIGAHASGRNERVSLELQPSKTMSQTNQMAVENSQCSEKPPKCLSKKVVADREAGEDRKKD